MALRRASTGRQDGTVVAGVADVEAVGVDIAAGSFGLTSKYLVVVRTFIYMAKYTLFRI